MSEPAAVTPSIVGGRGARAAIRAIEIYREAISPTRPPSCRYSPTCSAYALEAVRTYGLAKGLYLATRRLLRCHPFHRGGYDPVPARDGLGPNSDAAATHDHHAEERFSVA